ncbi:MAG: hypothetical protein ACRDRK_13640 [Pseudonocardia sp.]
MSELNFAAFDVELLPARTTMTVNSTANGGTGGGGGIGIALLNNVNILPIASQIEQGDVNAGSGGTGGSAASVLGG